jgi:DNA polymerase-3 subunit alpha
MNECDWLGTIKFDFLGIDNLSIINNCINLVRERTGTIIDMYEIPDGDELTYELLAKGYLTGVFQFETSGSAKKLVTACRPKSVEELSDLSALNRPGPLAKGPNGEPSIADNYTENKINNCPPEDMPVALQQLLAKTYWSMVYQEDVMRLCSKLANFTLREADDIRRAMG